MRLALLARRAAALVTVAALVVGAAVFVWVTNRPGPMSFASDQAGSLHAFAGHVVGAPADLSSKDPLVIGKYLTDAADCQACHTVPGGKPFAGGRAFATPFGTLYSPNITPDPETGIGRWSDEEFVKALHDGVGKGGKRLYPAFPYPSYAGMTDADALAIKTYLFSVPATHAMPPKNTLSFPFNQRPLMAVWSYLFNRAKPFEPVPARGAAWNRGAYLVELLAHCGECHTPRNALQALDHSKKFSGSIVDGWRAYNITTDKDSGLGRWSEAELSEYLSTGHAAGRGTAGGPMAEVVDLSLKQLTAQDVRAMSVYMASVASVKSNDLPTPVLRNAPPNPIGGSTVMDSNWRGREVFAGACVGCHGWTGTSVVSSRATLTGVRAINDPTAINVAQMILRGSEFRVPGTPSMPAFATAYDDAEIAAVANFVTARFGARPSRLTAEDVRTLRAPK